jgi:hypothetical protein
LENLILPLISTSELRTLRPLGLGALWREAGDELAALALDGLAGVLIFAGPADDAAGSGFCPITF